MKDNVALRKEAEVDYGVAVHTDLIPLFRAREGGKHIGWLDPYYGTVLTPSGQVSERIRTEPPKGSRIPGVHDNKAHRERLEAAAELDRKTVKSKLKGQT